MTTCNHCGTEFTPSSFHPNAKFCSVVCREKSRNQKRKAERLGNINQLPLTEPTSNEQPKTINQQPAKETPIKKVDIAIPNSLGDSATFIIKMVERDRDRFEKLYDSERATRKKLKEDKEKLEKEISDLKQSHELEKIANAKPTGLAGLSDNPLVNKLIDHIGPALGKLAERMTEPAAPQMAGIPGGEQNPAVAFANWLATKQPGTQEYILKMLLALSQVPDENVLIQKIAQIEQMVLGDYMRAAG